jgi:hypothetical protein
MACRVFRVFVMQQNVPSIQIVNGGLIHPPMNRIASRATIGAGRLVVAE